MSSLRRGGAREQATFWRDPNLNNLELLHATYVTHSFAPHTHEGYAIGVIEDGAERFKYRGSTHVAPQGSIVVINPGEMHTGAAAIEAGWRYRMLYPDVSLLQRAASKEAGHEASIPFFPSPVIHDPPLAAMLTTLHATLTASPFTLERDSKLTWAFTHLILRHADARFMLPPTTNERAHVQRVRAYLEGHFAENVSLEQLATLVNWSPFHLLRVFRDAIGLPPHSYLTQLRVMQAKRLLALTVSPAEVASMVGFSDQSHLTRHFKALVGVPPGEYARSCRR
ncbi:AraC family transcriptional regulator [Ktedonospora formicarum]|uniref:Transcriptional regulator n=1 Tax=Ktedonospora formicarum TaxID=2778364 RepID=A0A8J3I3M9_9CHLR|nr:AraC family transcriptional regulator [Ktedonospora formicarum]GHO46178.1 transcriptional regulator [Ktedonospora formicarum]